MFEANGGDRGSEVGDARSDGAVNYDALREQIADVHAKTVGAAVRVVDASKQELGKYVGFAQRPNLLAKPALATSRGPLASRRKGHPPSP